MKKVKKQLKLLKYRNKYTILLSQPNEIKRNKLKFKTKSKYKYRLILSILYKIFFIILLSCIYNSENNPKILMNMNNFISNYIIKKPYLNIKACLCVIGKNENLYVKEYVSYYKNLGYNHVYIYDNNDVNGERFEDVLEEELNSSFVTIKHYRGKSALHITRGPQCLAFRHCYENHKNECDWLSFFDFDEFLEVRPKANSIQEFLGNPRYNKCENIKINFLLYNDNNLLYYDNRSVKERFPIPVYSHWSNNIVKSTVKGGLEHNYWKKKCSVHTSYMNVTNCNSLGNIIPFDSGVNNPFNHTYAALKHYYTKSVEEYVNKTRRGDSFVYKGYNDYWKRKRMKQYFSYNNYSIEKKNLHKKLFDLE